MSICARCEGGGSGPLSSFRELWAVDFEFIAPPGERPTPVCLAAREINSGRVIRQWRDGFGDAPPYSTGPDALFIAYFASAELSCHLALDWPMPERILDLFVEFRRSTNGLPTTAGNGLVGALAHHGLSSIGADEKSGMRDLIMGGGPWSDAEKAAILDYCQSDVDALARLLPAMAPGIDLPRALLRGRYMAAVARMEHAGVPIDTETLERLRTNWDHIKHRLIDAVDTDYGVYDAGSFKADRFAAWLAKAGIPWPRLESGKLDLSDDAFREQARAYPVVAPLRELRASLSELRLNSLAVGSDGRNRTLLSPFRSRTGRNQPSNSKFIFGPSVWVRSLIKPPEGFGVCYIDWSQQEFGIAAALSGDRRMLDAYLSGDPYLAFAKQAGAVPEDATKQSHKQERDQYKACVLAVQYGMGAESLADRIAQPPVKARQLLQAHRETYSVFWDWSDSQVTFAMLHGYIDTMFGWRQHVGPVSNTRALMNYPMQAGGAEMLRLAACMAAEAGIEVAAPVHDAVLICSPLDRLDQDIERTRSFMAEASRLVLGELELRTDTEIVKYPDRYRDERGTVMWDRVMGLLPPLAEVSDICSGLHPSSYTYKSLNLTDVCMEIPPPTLEMRGANHANRGGSAR